jgi:hypothetical protein
MSLPRAAFPGHNYFLFPFLYVTALAYSNLPLYIGARTPTLLPCCLSLFLRTSGLSSSTLLPVNFCLVDYTSTNFSGDSEKSPRLLPHGVAESECRGVETLHTAGWTASPPAVIFLAFLLAHILVQLPELHQYFLSIPLSELLTTFFLPLFFTDLIICLAGAQPAFN